MSIFSKNYIKYNFMYLRKFIKYISISKMYPFLGYGEFQKSDNNVQNKEINFITQSRYPCMYK